MESSSSLWHIIIPRGTTKEDDEMKRNAGFNSERKFGVEIEFHGAKYMVALEMQNRGLNCQVESYNHQTRGWWKIVTDASCEFELVSPPLKGDEGLRQLKLACEALAAANARVAKDCGFHVHHDASDFSVETFKHLYNLYARYEDAIDSLHPVSRRSDDNRYCHSVRNYLGCYLRSINEATSVCDLTTQTLTRYLKLNCKSYLSHGTVEFRQHAGTTDFAKMSSWIVLTQAMVERAISGDIKMEGTATDWFNFKKVIRGYAWMGADEKLQAAIKFYNKRRTELTRNANAA
jgi:hypothetical protein